MEYYLLVSIENINNVGDELLRETTEFLISKARKDCSYHCQQMQFLPRISDLPLKYKVDYILGWGLVRWLSRLFPGQTKYQILNLGYHIQFFRFFSSQISKATKIVYTIGMLKYSTQNCSYFFHLINSIAEKYHKPVLMSALSVERADSEDWRYHQLVHALSFSCVKAITTRDGDEGLCRLRSDYLFNKTIVSDYVGDPALWVPEYFQINPSVLDSFRPVDRKRVIGIGVIRKSIFQLYNQTYTEIQLLELYREIIEETERRGYDYYLFCNGIKSDYEFGLELVSFLKLPPPKLIPPPHSGDEYVGFLTGFDAIIGVRLHACICAVSLGIPVVGIIWDNKLERFGATMGIRDFFVSMDELNGRVILDKLEVARSHPFDWEAINRYKIRTLRNLELFLNDEI